MVKEKAGTCNWLHCERPRSNRNPLQNSPDLGKCSSEFLPKSHCFKLWFLIWIWKIWNLICDPVYKELIWDRGGRTCWDSRCWAAAFAHHQAKLRLSSTTLRWCRNPHDESGGQSSFVAECVSKLHPATSVMGGYPGSSGVPAANGKKIVDSRRRLEKG